MGKLKGSIEVDSFQSNQFLNTLKQICFKHDINLDVSTTGLFYKTHFIKAEGEDNKIIALKKWIDETIELNQ
jgi:hypothetical protein